MGFLITTVLVLFGINCLFLIFLVMVQSGKGGSTGGMLTGGGSSSAFGASTADVMTKITRWSGVLFIVLALVLSFLFAKTDDTLVPETMPAGSLIEALPDAENQEATTPAGE
ncbi:preprotein translocase subunit SecG [Leptospira sp. GIMC2001]|uniref:preprotein translocase subunit SecG n=1 Tax=Leptospira sp. GIMC2001 TaxID=1513297 RepID=UPI002349A809|nr:preprotein translocase subunit SecG [Leptospira sp. GIMC2001]WCL48299.1 preprotein translocase subunit SecG [Leptospira sp. GIMC2001]